MAEHLSAEMASWCGEIELPGGGTIDELAAAVASYIQESSTSDAVSSAYLVMLSSRALTSIGEHRAAQRVLVHGTGLVRPAQWEVTGEDSMWVLDLKQITMLAEASLELVLFQSLNLIVETLADVWNDTSGRGVLGLRHVSSAAARLLGSAGDRRLEEMAREIRGVCEDRLRRIADERGWVETPAIMDLDLFA